MPLVEWPAPLAGKWFSCVQLNPDFGATSHNITPLPRPPEPPNEHRQAMKTLTRAIYIALIAGVIFDKEKQDMSYPTSRTFARRTWERDPHEMATCVYKPYRRSGDMAVIVALALAVVVVVLAIAFGGPV